MIAAPTSTKNEAYARDPEIHQSKKANQWHFGIKAHIGVVEESGLVHTVITTAANIIYVNQTQAHLHGQKEEVSVDAGYLDFEKREDMKATLANEQEVKWRIAKQHKTIQKMDKGWQKNWAQAYEKLKPQIRAGVERPFHIIKNIFKNKKTRYKGIKKNNVQLNMLFGLSNLYMTRENYAHSL